MADERYQWLDQDAAERLLRGDQVESIGDHTQHQARRLADALDAVRTPGAWPGGRPAAEPLRGEEAALAAFRKARDGGGAELLPTVQLAAPASSRPVRWARPVRWGLAASLAGFAVGGVAVAAGTGLLPTPFGGDRNPAPASSVSAAVTPGPLVSDAPSDDDGVTTPVAPSSGPGSPSAPPSSGASVPTGGTGLDKGAGGGSREDGRTDQPSGNDRDGFGDRYRKTVEACRDYRSGRLDEDRRRRLEDAANGADRIGRFCDRVLSGGDGTSGDGNDGGSGSDGGGDGDGDGDGGDPGGDDDADGSPAPPVLPVEPAHPAFPVEPVRPALPVRPAP
ncbi:hypothetical protein, partial [Streptomyces sp. NPDC001970]